MLAVKDISLFLIASVALAFTPGPDMLYIFVHSVTKGVRAGLRAALGIYTGLIMHTLIAGLGLSALVTSSPFLFKCIRWSGAIYLIGMGVQMWQKKAENRMIYEGNPVSSYGNLYSRGIYTNLLNPKIILFFIAFFPQFIRISQGSARSLSFVVTFLFLGFLFLLIESVFTLLLVILASLYSDSVRRSVRGSVWINGGSALVFIGLGLTVLVCKLPY